MDRWKFARVIEGFSEPSSSIEEDSRGIFWFGHQVKGLYKIQLDESLSRTVSVEYFGKNKGFSAEHHVQMCNVQGEMIFTADDRIYRYDPLLDSVLHYALLNEKLSSFGAVKRISRLNGEGVWIVTEKAFVLAQVRAGRLEVVELHILPGLGKIMPDRNEHVIALDHRLFLLCLDGGYALYRKDGVSQYVPIERPEPVFLRTVFDGSSYLDPASSGLSKTIPFSKNHIRFEVSAPEYNRISRGYQYLLDGYDENWSAPGTLAQQEYQRLPSGTYTFRARLMDEFGNPGDACSYTFRIGRPWYASNPVLALYLALAIGMLMVANRWNKYKLSQKQRALRLQLEREKLTQMRQHREQHEKQLMVLRNEQLRAEVNNKVKQLAGSTLGAIRKNESIMKVKMELVRHRRELETASGPSFFRRLLKVIDENLGDQEDWSLFENNFDEAHENFIKRLRGKHPELSPNDLRFCAYLRMNLTSKEMASLLNVTVRGVEIRRYRLRKRLGLGHEQNLTAYMMDF